MLSTGKILGRVFLFISFNLNESSVGYFYVHFYGGNETQQN